MPVDIFGRTTTGISQRVVSGGVTSTQVNNTFLRRDGTNTATGNLNLDSHKIINVSDPDTAQGVATKHYVDTKVPLPYKQFVSLYAQDLNSYIWSDYQTIQYPQISENDFDNLPAGLYGCYTNYLPPTRLGSVPTDTKGYIITLTYQQPVDRNKYYKFISINGEQWEAYFKNGVWYTWVSTNKLSSVGDTMSGDLNMGGNLVKGLPVNYPPLYHGDEAVSWTQAIGLIADATTNNGTVPIGDNYLTNKKYVDDRDALKVNKAGDTMTGDLLLSSPVDITTIRRLGCLDVPEGKSFILLLGNDFNKIFYDKVLNQNPVVMQTSAGFMVRVGGNEIMQIGNTESAPRIIVHKDIAMNSHKIRFLPEPTDADEASTKNYSDTKVAKSGDTMTGDLNMGGKLVKGLPVTYPPVYSGSEAVSWNQAVNLVNNSAYMFIDKYPPVDMTGLTAPAPFVVTTNNSTPSGWYAFAHVDAQDWLCSSPTNSWVQITGNVNFVVKRIVIRGSFNGSTGTITTWKLEGSNDNTTWTQIVNQSSPGGGNLTLATVRNLTVANNISPYSSYRFSCLGGSGTVSINYIGLYNGITTFNTFGDNVMQGNIDMNLRSIINLTSPNQPTDAANKSYVDNLTKKCYFGYIPLMDTNVCRLGFIASASATATGLQPYGAFNSLNADNAGGCWVTPGGTTTGWLQIKCPEAVTIWRVALKARSFNGRNITAWNIAASNDGLTFTTLLTSTTALLGSATNPSFFNISTTTAYQYYRFNITASTGSADFGVQVMQLYVVTN